MVIFNSLVGRAGLVGREGAGDVGAGRRDEAGGEGGGAAPARALPHLQVSFPVCPSPSYKGIWTPCT